MSVVKGIDFIMTYSPRERFFKTLKGENAGSLVCDYEPFSVLRDPISVVAGGNRQPGKEVRDVFGTTIVWPEGVPGPMPHVTDENKVLRDICNWKNELVIPNYESLDCDWKPAQESMAAIDRENKLVTVVMGTGLFERLHFLMGFEDTLVNLIVETEAVHELLDALLEVRMTHARLLIENLRPEVVIHHDDWGNKQSLFMRSDLWRELFKERYRKLFAYLRENGIIVVHHADCHCADIAEDMADIGVQVWQGVIPDNDITPLQKKLGGKMTLMGGIDSVIDRPDATEDEIRSEVRRVCKTYGPAGYFIPSMTYGLPGSIYPHVLDIIVDEISRYNNGV